ncbi:MAG: tRNA pseudouridine(38-40) synthase TruA [Leptospirillia bacterium]
MSRIRLTIQYDGAAYAGWQVQPDAVTVQGTLEQAAAAIEGEPVTVTGSGRTDAGVHALGQVAHFDTGKAHDSDTWLRALNANLPPDIAVFRAESVPDDFHARHSAIGKTYRYRILNRPTRCPFRRGHTWFYSTPLDVEAMAEAAALLVGEFDCSSFRASGCGARHPVRRIDAVRVWSENDEVVFEMDGKSFLKQMVRNIVGTLVKVGSGAREPEWVSEVIEARDRSAAGETAPAAGLTMVEVRYPPLPA